MSDSPVPLPKDPRHQRFADHVLSGKSLTDAYAAAGFKAGKDSLSTAAARLRKRPDVVAYITAIQERAADESTLSLMEIRRFLARIVRVPVTHIDADNMTAPDHDLIKKFRKKVYAGDEMKGTEDYTIEELEKHDPLKAIEMDLKISGNDPESNALKDLAAALGKIASTSPLPTGKL